MPATMRRLRTLEMCTLDHGTIFLLRAGPTSYIRIHCAELRNGLGCCQQQIAQALYQCFKRIQHACVNDTLANEAVDLAKTAGNALVLCGVRKFQNTLGTLKVKKVLENSANSLRFAALVSVVFRGAVWCGAAVLWKHSFRIELQTLDRRETHDGFTGFRSLEV